MYTCKICNTLTATIRGYVDHVSSHRNIPRVRFPCCFVNCGYTLSTFAAMKIHVTRYHRHIQKQTAVAAKLQSVNLSLICMYEICQKELTDLSSYLAHLKAHIRKGQVVSCPYKKCKRDFSKTSSFTAHLSRHRNWGAVNILDKYKLSTRDHCSLDQDIPLDTNCFDVSTETDRFVIENDISCDFENSNNCQGRVQETGQSRLQFQQNFALFLLKLQAKQLVPSQTIQMIVEELQTIHSLCQQDQVLKITQKLRDEGLAEERIKCVADYMNEIDAWIAIVVKENSERSTVEKSNLL